MIGLTRVGGLGIARATRAGLAQLAPDGPSLAPAAASRPPERRYLVTAAAATLLAAAIWPAYVFGDSQAAYLAALVGSCTAAVLLGWAGSRAVLVLIVAEIGLLGTEVSGQLAAGHAPLGNLRLIDATVAAGCVAAGTRVVGEAWRNRRRYRLPELLRPWQLVAAAGTMIRRRPLGSTIFVALLWMVVLWAAHGHPRDTILRGDIRPVLLGLGVWLLGMTCVRGDPRRLAYSITLIGAAVAAKATAIYFAGLTTIGDFDRLQSVTDRSATPHHPRIILDSGGDTVEIIAVGAAVLAFSRANSLLERLGLALCGCAAIWGLLLSGTRTNVLVSVLLAVGTGIAIAARRATISSRNRRRALLLVGLLVAAVAAASFPTGVIARFTNGNPGNTGLNFRVDEIRSVSHLPPADVILGQGFGGRFIGTSSFGTPVLTGWSHVFPNWIVLKVGIIGLAVLLLAAGVSTWRLIRQARHRLGDGGVLGAVLFVGTLAISLTLGRAALPDGMMLLGMGAALLSGRQGVPS